MLNKLLAVLIISLFCTLAVAEDSTLEIIPISYRSADEMLPLIEPLLEPTDRIASDGANLIVRTTPQRLAQIKDLIAQLDARPHNLLITVLQSQNASAEQLNASADAYINIPISKPSATSGGIQGELNSYRGSSTSGNTQSIRTLEGQAAYIKTGSTQPVPTVSVYGPGYPTVVNSTAMVEATTGFAVTPRLSGGEVILSVSPWSDRMQNNGTIDTQSAETNVRAKLGEWIEIGGVQQQSHNSRQGLFSVDSGTRSNELHILVKVEVID